MLIDKVVSVAIIKQNGTNKRKNFKQIYNLPIFALVIVDYIIQA